MLLSLSSLHNTHNNSIQDVLSLRSEAIAQICSRAALARYRRFVNIGRYVVDFYVRVSECGDKLGLFLGLEVRCLSIFLVEDLLPGVAEVLEGLLQVSLLNVRGLLDLSERELGVSVEKHEDHCLVTVHHEDVGLRSDVDGLHLQRAVLEQPCDVTVLVFLLVELFKLHSVIFEFRRESASSWSLLGPVAIGENLCVEFNTRSLHVLEGLSLLELIHQILGNVDVIEHRGELVDCVVTTLDLELLKHQLFSIL